MTLLPIVSRELLEASRRSATYWIRLAVAAVALLLGGWILLVMHRAPANFLGATLFGTISIAACVYAGFIGVFRTADCLSEEKRDGTLGLLFLTDLKGYDIVFGKLAATSLNAFYGMLALFPVMAIPLLMGGVTMAEFWRMVLVSLNTLFLSLAVGMFCSSISRDERRAMGAALGIMLFFAIGFPLLAAFAENFHLPKRIVEALLVPSPGYAVFRAFELRFRAPGSFDFYIVLAVTHLLSWFFLLAACWIVPRTWQDKALSAEAIRRRERLHRFAQGKSDFRRGFRTELLQVNPFYWLVARHRMKPAAVWMFLGLGAVIWSLGLIYEPRDWKDDPAYFFTAIIAHTVIKFWLASEASRRLSLDRQSGALELLLSTPLPVREIVRGQWLGLQRQFGGPVLVILFVDFVFLIAGKNQAPVVLWWIALMLVFVADLLALGWVAMWRGLNARGPNRAAAVALAQVMALPSVIFCILLTLLAVSDGIRGSDWETAPIVIWAMISLVVSAMFGFSARQKLLAQFREVATRRFEHRTKTKV